MPGSLIIHINPELKRKPMNRPDLTVNPGKKPWTKGEIVSLYHLLTQMRGIRGVQFLKIVALLLEEIRYLGEGLSAEKCIPSYKSFMKYQGEIARLQRKHGIITEKDILDNEEYRRDIRKLNSENEKIAEEYHQDLEEYNAMLDEEFTERELNWRYFTSSIIPENISSEVYLAIYRLIDDK